MNTLGTKILICIMMFTILAAPGCIGSFALTKRIYDWNTNLGNKWGNWGVFLVFVIFPVYFFLLLGDMIIFNTIEFYGGDNPFADKAEGPKVIEEGDKRVVLERQGDRVHTLVYNKGELVEESYLHQDEDGAFVKTNADGKMMAKVLKRDDGSALVTDASGDQREYTANQVASFIR